MSSFFQELKRRNVFRVGAAYAVVAWLIIQVIETISGPLGLPAWTEAFFIVVLLAGLPLILLFSWAFELTPEGLKKTKDVKAEESVTEVTGKKLNFTIIAVLVMALGYFLWERQGLVEQVEQSAAEMSEEVIQTEGVASVAVLPFVNMSADPEQEFFSDGISEELLNLLAKIPQIRVPARTSSFQFKGQNLDIGDVARQLNVKHVLEGSVRKADVRVRVTAQLIEAETGYHLWSETYDRELNDIFAIQDEISAAIVAALSKTLGLKPGPAPTVTRASDPEAYNAYLLAQHQIKKRTKVDIESAIPNYERAIRLDPDYAPARAGLGLAWYLLTASGSTYGDLSLEESLAKAEPQIKKALELDPMLADAHGVMGLLLASRDRDEDALPYYERALELNPSFVEARNWYALDLTGFGRHEESFAQLQRAYELDPLSVLTLNNYTGALLRRDRFELAQPLIDRLMQIDAARGALFTGRTHIRQGRFAEGLAIQLRGIGSGSDFLGLRREAALNLWGLGFEEAALRIWPDEDHYPLVSRGIDVDDDLRNLAQKRFINDPNNPEMLQDLAWATFFAGDTAEASRLAERRLQSLGDVRRARTLINLIVAFDASKRGDQATVMARVVPVEAALDELRAAGVNVLWLNSLKSMAAELRGASDVALQYLEQMAFKNIRSVDRMALDFAMMGWDDKPEFQDLQRRHRQFIEKARAELLAVACGPDGFDAWQPAPVDCSVVASTALPD